MSPLERALLTCLVNKVVELEALNSVLEAAALRLAHRAELAASWLSGPRQLELIEAVIAALEHCSTVSPRQLDRCLSIRANLRGENV